MKSQSAAEIKHFQSTLAAVFEGLTEYHSRLDKRANRDAVENVVQKSFQDTGNQQMDYETLRDAVERALENLPATADLMIEACAHTDDWVHDVTFDAAAWFEQASEKEVDDLINCGFRGNYAADAVAQFMEGKDDAISDLFDHDSGDKDLSGFECIVDETDAVNWLREHRSAWLEKHRDVLDCFDQEETNSGDEVAPSVP